MTITIAWVREVQGCEELYVVSDSRLSGNGMKWDECRKLSILPREDAFVSFAGNTDVAFPIINQIEETIMVHNRSKNRFMDVADLKGHLLNVVNTMVTSIDFSGFPDNIVHKIRIETFENIEFLFGGYSWIQKRFMVWRIRYQKSLKMFVADSMYKVKPYGKIIFAGDVKFQAMKKYYELGRNKIGNEFFTTEKNFDMEPLDVVVELLREHKSDSESTIGGAPQIIKIYQHMNARIIGVLWPPENPTPTILGRKLLSYENTDVLIIDPLSKSTESIPYSKNSIDNTKFNNSKLNTIKRLASFINEISRAKENLILYNNL